jgi:hypothetical protein
MSGSIDRVAIKLSLNKDVELTCYPSVKEFLKLITEYMSGEAQGTFGDVIISELTPESEDVNKLWIRTNGQRNGFEQRIYINGEWKPWYFLPSNGYIMFPSSATLPEGFTEIGRFKGSDIPVQKNGVTLTTPTEFIIAEFTGY